MSRVLIAAVLLVATALPAAAYCPSVPDDAATQYVRNQQELMLCHQAELADLAAMRAREAEIRAQLAAQQMQLLDMQRRLAEQFATRPLL